MLRETVMPRAKNDPERLHHFRTLVICWTVYLKICMNGTLLFRDSSCFTLPVLMSYENIPDAFSPYEENRTFSALYRSIATPCPSVYGIPSIFLIVFEFMSIITAIEFLAV